MLFLESGNFSTLHKLGTLSIFLFMLRVRFVIET
jgi:hypothetical protein